MKKAGIVFAALLAVALITGSAFAAAEKVYYETPFGQVVYKPKRIEFSGLTLTHIRWRHWNGRRALGRGRARVNTCDPSCGTGRIVRGTARLRMFQRHREGDRLFYGCMKGTTRAAGRTERVQWPPGCGD